MTENKFNFDHDQVLTSMTRKIGLLSNISSAMEEPKSVLINRSKHYNNPNEHALPCTLITNLPAYLLVKKPISATNSPSNTASNCSPLLDLLLLLKVKFGH